MLQDFAAYASCRLLHPHDRAIAEIRLNKEDHFFVAHEDVVAADIIQPALYGCFDPCLIFIRAGTGRGERRGNSWNQCFRVRRYQMLGELDKLRVRASDIPELRRPELW